MSFELAIKAGLPLISVTTADTIHLEEALEELCGRKVSRWSTANKKSPSPGEIYFYEERSMLPTPVAQYNLFGKKETRATLIVVNPPEKHPAFHDAGVLPTPRSLVYEFLSDYMPEVEAKKLIPALGGLTLKEITDVMMLTQARDGGNSVAGIIKTRQMYLNRVQGLEIVNTEIAGYMPDKDVQLIAKQEKKFFLGDYDYRLRMRGILAYGPPGTGKSLSAKYLAREWGIPLFRLDATIQSKWVGESEGNLLKALKHLEAEAPCIFLIDEIEKLFAKDDDGTGTTQKMMAGLLWWLQEHRSKVLTYMTSNAKTKLPPELYRAGRVDRQLRFTHLNMGEAISVGAIISQSFPEAVMPTVAEIRELIEGFKNKYDINTDDAQFISPAQVNVLVLGFIKDKIRGPEKKKIRR